MNDDQLAERLESIERELRAVHGDLRAVRQLCERILAVEGTITSEVRQFDAVLHLDETHAVEPLERTAVWESGEAPETYPSAL